MNDSPAREDVGPAPSRPLKLRKAFRLDDLDIRRRRIRIRAWRRGMRELDILMGGFVDARIDTLADSDLAELEELLELPDAELLSWLAGGAPPPPERNTALLKAIIAFHTHDGPIH